MVMAAVPAAVSMLLSYFDVERWKLSVERFAAIPLDLANLVRNPNLRAEEVKR